MLCPLSEEDLSHIHEELLLFTHETVNLKHLAWTRECNIEPPVDVDLRLCEPESPREETELEASIHSLLARLSNHTTVTILSNGLDPLDLPFGSRGHCLRLYDGGMHRNYSALIDSSEIRWALPVIAKTMGCTLPVIMLTSGWISNPILHGFDDDFLVLHLFPTVLIDNENRDLVARIHQICQGIAPPQGIFPHPLEPPDTFRSSGWLRDWRHVANCVNSYTCRSTFLFLTRAICDFEGVLRNLIISSEAFLGFDDDSVDGFLDKVAKAHGSTIQTLTFRDCMFIPEHVQDLVKFPALRFLELGARESFAPSGGWKDLLQVLASLPELVVCRLGFEDESFLCDIETLSSENPDWEIKVGVPCTHGSRF